MPDEKEIQKKIEQVYEKLSPFKQKLITPYVYTNDEFAMKWEDEKAQERKGFGGWKISRAMYRNLHRKRRVCALKIRKNSC